MVLSNKRESYDVEHSSATLKLSGTFTWTSDKRIIDFNGSFRKIDGTPTGYFNYGEMEDGLTNKNITSFPLELQDEGNDILRSTVAAIKSQLQ